MSGRDNDTRCRAPGTHQAAGADWRETTISEIVVVALPNETSAYEGLRAIDELHEEGGRTL